MANKITKEKHDQNSLAMQIPIVQLSAMGEFIREWPSGTTASKELNVPRSVIIDVLRRSRGHCERKAKTVLGTIFVYKKDYDPTKDYSIVYKMYAPANLDILSEKGVVELSDGVPIKYFPNTTIAARYYKTSRGAIGVKIHRDKRPRKFRKPSAQRVPDTVTFLMNLKREQVEYIKKHYRDIVIRTA